MKLSIPIPGIRRSAIEVPSLPGLGSKAGQLFGKEEAPAQVDLFVGYLVTISGDDCPLGDPAEALHPARQVKPAGRNPALGSLVRWNVPRQQHTNWLESNTVVLEVWQTNHAVGLLDPKRPDLPGLSEYLGPSEEGYVYAVVPDEVESICPDVRDRIRAVLGIYAP
jgi:hypothetical protein